MEPEEWAEIERLFDAALEVPRAQRAEWLDRVCAGNDALRSTLERLIRKFDEPSRDVRDQNPIFSRGQLVAGRFRVVDLIARGGMGEVYKVRDQKLHGIQIALKTLRPDITSERAALERFMREVWVPREIADEGICRVFELVEHREVDQNGTETIIPCLTMQLLEGETLAGYLARRRPLPIGEACRIVSSVGRSLQVLHDNGVIHRDLKPSNIMMVPRDDGDPRPVIIDFGLAKRDLTAGAGGDSKTAPLPGSPYFLAPEVFQGHKGSIASDIYAFGVIIDTLVTNRNAFSYSSDEELLYRKLKEEPEPPSARSEGLPAIWEEVILSCLRRNPSERPARPADVSRLLEGDITAPPLPARIAAAADGAIPPERRRWSRRVWIAAGCGAAAVASSVTLAGLSAAPLEGSVLVFPFLNLTSKPEFDHLCLGAETELVRRLRRLSGLKVYSVPRNAKLDKNDLARGRVSLECNLQFGDGSPYFAMRLLQTATSQTLKEWRIGDSATDLVAVQESIASRTLEEVRAASEANAFESLMNGFLPARWTGSPVPLPRPASGISAALREYQRGQQTALTRTPAAAREAIACFDRAVAHDSRFALAYSARADIRQVLMLFNWGESKTLMAEVLADAEKAVELDASHAECHVSLASAQQHFWDWTKTEESFLAAIAADTQYAKAHYWYGGMMLQFGKVDQGLAEARLGLDRDPFDQALRSTYGLYLWLGGKPREAVDHLEAVLQKGNLINTYINLGQAYAELARQSKKADATQYFLKSIAAASEVHNREKASAGGTDPGYLKWSDVIFSQAYASRGDIEAARSHAERLERGYEAGKITASTVAWAYSVIGERRRALELLGEGFRRREREMFFIRVHPLYRNLHPAPSFQRIVRDMGLAG